MSPAWSQCRVYAVMTAIAALAVSTACSSSGHHTATLTRTVTVPATGTTVRGTAPATANPQLAVGSTTRIELSASDALNLPAGNAEVTLTAKRAATSIVEDGVTARPDPNKQFICLQFKIKNVGASELDLFPFTQATWSARSGETTNEGGVLEVDCAALGLSGDDITSLPNPKPDQFVQGTTIFEVSNTQPGSLQFSDRAQTPMFTIGTAPTH